MKTSSKIVTGLVLATVVASGVYAKGNYEKGSCQMGEGKKMMMQKHSKKGGHGITSMLSKLNLTQEQKNQIADIKKDMMKEKVSPSVAFSKDGFDKDKFIEIMKQKRENMIESKAEMIHRVYKVLTPKQKEQLKVLMELKKEKKMAMMNKRMNS